MNKENTPIILANTEWMPPERLLNEVKVERMLTALCDLIKPDLMDYKDLVGDAECLAYLMPETNRRVLNSDWTEIYLYLARRVLKKWDRIKDLPENIKLENISDYQQKKLDNLKFFIYKYRGGKENNPIIQTLKKVFFNKNKTSKKRLQSIPDSLF